MILPDPKELAWFEKMKVAPPTHDNHGVQDTWENPLSDKLVAGNPRNWRMEGNRLMCDTDFGPLVQNIPTDYICLGTDQKGLPILKKVLS